MFRKQNAVYKTQKKSYVVPDRKSTKWFSWRSNLATHIANRGVLDFNVFNAAAYLWSWVTNNLLAAHRQLDVNGK